MGDEVDGVLCALGISLDGVEEGFELLAAEGDVFVQFRLGVTGEIAGYEEAAEEGGCVIDVGDDFGDDFEGKRGLGCHG